ncbi:heme peroxidase [Mycobacterium intracellulare]|uniref:heme peroxidase n=1 Tax=Mycobacterium intracellulare TaxID=1767 RepID=UPI001CD96715|nr:heme peroxidase [Mycobacterium intracellulare]MCA2304809.1 heme peroxidase [Mycobacterium intracellulare]MCA2347160.1 heme peroxidase [Mycobacterium intracellulare]
MSADFSARELQQLVAMCKQDLGVSADWIAPPGYPNSLALCVIDAVFSINATYTGVVNVVNQYRRHRAEQHGEADTDGVIELLGTFELAKGSDGWADKVENHWRTSTRSGSILKAEAVRQEAHVLAEHGVWSVADLHTAAVEKRLAALERDWLAVTGQGSGISWSYVPILARPHGHLGAPPELVDRYAEAVVGVKPDRMVKRFVARAIGVPEQQLPNQVVHSH